MDIDMDWLVLDDGFFIAISRFKEDLETVVKQMKQHHLSDLGEWAEWARENSLELQYDVTVYRATGTY